MYGCELISDLSGCDVKKFNWYSIREFFIELCEVLNVERVGTGYCESEPGDDTEGNPKTNGISAVQFLTTSSICLHALPLTGLLFINVFTCGQFDADEALRVVYKHFSPAKHTQRIVNRACTHHDD